MPRAQASLPTTSWSGTPCVRMQLPARVAWRISISVSSAQSLEPSPPAAFIYSARCSLGAGNGAFFFFFSGLLDAGWIFPALGGFSGAFAGSLTSPEGRGGGKPCSVGRVVDPCACRGVCGRSPH